MINFNYSQKFHRKLAGYTTKTNDPKAHTPHHTKHLPPPKRAESRLFRGEKIVINMTFTKKMEQLSKYGSWSIMCLYLYMCMCVEWKRQKTSNEQHTTEPNMKSKSEP